MNKVLIVDDDPGFRLMLKTFLEKKGFEVQSAGLAKDGKKILEKESFNIVLVDFRLPDKTGLELLKDIKTIDPHVPVILITSYADIRTAVKAIKLGAYEYVTKPVNTDEMLSAITNALNKPSDTLAIAKTSASNSLMYIKGESSGSQKINEYIDLVAPTNISVIIQGESGTGKEYVARMIHFKSKRAEKPFVAIDCGALSKDLAASELFGHLKGSFTGALTDKVGHFEFADGGTIFLDEIGNLSYDIQIKLLRALQERKIRKVGGNKDIDVDVRIIVATNEDLLDAVKKSNFREDLYHRLNEFKIHVPPLREREEDIETFSTHFLNNSNKELEKEVKGFSSDVLEVFKQYSWPGNIRELKNVIKRAVLLADNSIISVKYLPAEIVSPPPAEQDVEPRRNDWPVTTDLKAIAERTEREMIVDTLEKVKYNKSKAAKILNIDRKTLYNKLKLYNIDA